MQSQTSKVVYERHISCDGGGGALGHPKIYLEIKSGINEIDCPYCGQHFEYVDVEAKTSANKKNLK
jgi:uncharacterized Zn-finger protein